MACYTCLQVNLSREIHLNDFQGCLCVYARTHKNMHVQHMKMFTQLSNCTYHKCDMI